MTGTTAQIAGLALNFSQGEAAPDWVQLTPSGPQIRGRDGRNWILPNPEAVVAAFRDHGADLPIDIEHATQLKGANGEPAPAVGWIKDMDVRAGAIWARVEWTEDGANAVASRAYRYLSPVFRFEQPTSEVLAMISAGLTNRPNLAMEALNSEGQIEESNMDRAVLDALGLAQGATAADAVVAINALKEARDTALNQARTPDPEKFVPKADHDQALNRIAEFEEAEQGRTDAAIEAALDAATEAGKITPASRSYHEATCRQEGGLQRFEEMIAVAPKIVAPSGLGGKDVPGTGEALNAEEQAVCAALGMSHEDFKEAKAAENKE